MMGLIKIVRKSALKYFCIGSEIASTPLNGHYWRRSLNSMKNEIVERPKWRRGALSLAALRSQLFMYPFIGSISPSWTGLDRIRYCRQKPTALIAITAFRLFLNCMSLFG